MLDWTLFVTAPPSQGGEIRAIRTAEAQIWVQSRLSVNADDSGLGHRLRKHVDVTELEVLARAVGVAFDNDSFRVRQVRQPCIIPAGVGHAATVAGLEGVDRTCTCRSLICRLRA